MDLTPAPAPLSLGERFTLIADLHEQWEADPPSIRELLHAPVWALRLEDVARVTRWIDEHPQGGRQRSSGPARRTSHAGSHRL